jgi:membrane-bound lytic murein transglycosylase F
MFPDLISTFVAGLLALYFPSTPTTLKRVRDNGVMSVAVRVHPSSYYSLDATAGGFDYELAHQFADRLGVRLNLIVVKSIADSKRMILHGRADLAATALHVLEENTPALRYGPVYGQTRSVVVYRQGSKRPRKPSDLEGKKLVVPAGTAHARTLRELKPDHPALTWTEVNESGVLQLLRNVYEGIFEFTLADDYEFSDIRRVYPELRTGFEIVRQHGFAWALPRDADDSLYFEMLVFLNALRSSGRLAQMRDYYFRRPGRFDYVDARQFLSHVEVRLPRYKKIFKNAAEKNGLDWRLLAALGYQESHWNPEAVSPTGVRGLMMLTRVTAAHLGIEDRLDPKQSIRGGARYFRTLVDRIPDRIEAPDRTWLAIAAYNIGYGHLEDARVLAQANGGNPDRWEDVRRFLLLKEKAEWHGKTRHGFARGAEAVYYVGKVQRYYETLISLDLMASL